MGLDADELEWNDLARRDAMWAVCSSPELRGRWDTTRFFESGEEEVGGIIAGLEQAGLLPARMEHALDFGCGVGRLTRALSSLFGDVIGVDLSAQMIEEAGRANEHLANAQFVVNTRPDLVEFANGQFDFVLSLIALQHVSSREAIRAYLCEFVRVVRPGGIVAFQLPARVAWRVRLHPLRMGNRVIRRLPRAPDALLGALMPHSMSLNALPEREVRELLADAGGSVETAFEDRRVGTAAVSSLFYVVSIPDA